MSTTYPLPPFPFPQDEGNTFDPLSIEAQLNRLVTRRRTFSDPVHLRGTVKPGGGDEERRGASEIASSRERREEEVERRPLEEDLKTDAVAATSSSSSSNEGQEKCPCCLQRESHNLSTSSEPCLTHPELNLLSSDLKLSAGKPLPSWSPPLFARS
jgi:hypothetical protein